MSLTRIACASAVAGALFLATACGGFEPDPGAQGPIDTPSTPLTSTPSGPTTPSTPASTTPATPKKPKATPTNAGDGGDDGDGAPSTRGGGVCGHVGAGQVSAIIGVTVKGAAVEGATGCTFEQGGSRGTTVTVTDRSVAQAGGIDGAKEEANSAVEGTPEDLTGIGAAAFVVTGSMFGGPETNAAGAVQVGDRIISVLLDQHSGLAETEVRSMEVSLLKLVAGAAS